jgi:hypothetical protein
MRVTPVWEQAVYLFKDPSAYGRLYVVHEGQHEDSGTHVALGAHWCIRCPVWSARLRHGLYSPGQEEDRKGPETGRRASDGSARRGSLDPCQR